MQIASPASSIPRFNSSPWGQRVVLLCYRFPPPSRNVEDRLCAGDPSCRETAASGGTDLSRCPLLTFAARHADRLRKQGFYGQKWARQPAGPNELGEVAE